MAGMIPVRVLQDDVTKVACDALVVNLFEGVTQPGGATGAVDRALDGAISRLIREGEVSGKAGRTSVIHTQGRMPAVRVVVAGLGPQDGFGFDEVREAAGTAARAACATGARVVATVVHGAGIGGLDAARAAESTVLGSLLATHTPVSHAKKKSDPPGRRDLGELLLVERNGDKVSAFEGAARRAAILAGSQCWARDLVAEPANLLPPSELASRAAEMASRAGIECSVLGRDQLQEMGAGAILAVGQGSTAEPCLITLKLERGGGGARPLALVGKAVTFDSGGLSLKVREGMEMMKTDMAGGAVVIAAMRALAELGARVSVIAVVPAVENMPSGGAQRPGDVLTTMDGRTVEVISTDAEGRLILADAVTYARRQAPRAVVDVATLTGACRVALGEVYSGLVSNDDSLAAAVEAAAREAGERVWRLPHHRLYSKQLKSKVADLKNTGGREAGAITGGMFIGAFAGDTPWAHLDIAATSWTRKDLPDCPEGPTGYGMRTLVRLALETERTPR